MIECPFVEDLWYHGPRALPQLAGQVLGGGSLLEVMVYGARGGAEATALFRVNYQWPTAGGGFFVDGSFLGCSSPAGQLKLSMCHRKEIVPVEVPTKKAECLTTLSP